MPGITVGEDPAVTAALTTVLRIPLVPQRTMQETIRVDSGPATRTA